ncbi:tRNA wybutosine-synthesizing protein 3 [Trichoderma asperellum]|nr:methyltransferase TYW3-domain-containing protein [Trichoderma asperelloides]
MQSLGAPSAPFREKKAKILQQLAIPDADYSDASPKGSVDEGIRYLIDEINTAEGYVTTSSCAGRASVFLEGRKSKTGDGENGESEQVARVGGKGAGGTWLYVSHDPKADGGEGYMDWMKELGLPDAADVLGIYHDASDERRLIHFKFEPMILHVLTASLGHAQLLLRCALQAGFRESGAINITSPSSEQTTPMVAIRSMGLSLESLIGYEDAQGQRRRIVPPEYLKMLLQISNERFVENTKRIERFRSALKEAILEPKPANVPKRLNPEGKEWEDAAARRERLRAEGLKRKAALQAEKKESTSQDIDVDLQMDPSFE